MSFKVSDDEKVNDGEPAKKSGAEANAEQIEVLNQRTAHLAKKFFDEIGEDMEAHDSEGFTVSVTSAVATTLISAVIEQVHRQNHRNKEDEGQLRSAVDLITTVKDQVTGCLSEADAMLSCAEKLLLTHKIVGDANAQFGRESSSVRDEDIALMKKAGDMAGPDASNVEKLKIFRKLLEDHGDFPNKEAKLKIVDAVIAAEKEVTGDVGHAEETKH